jgi:ABC-type phosphate transport system substrate-binding protein
MFRRPLVIVIVMVAGLGVLAAGCGSSSNTPTTPSNASAGSTTGGGAATTTASASGGGSSGGASSNPAVAQAVTACKASINSTPTLSASLKTKLTGLCDKAAHGDEAGVKKVAAEVCKDIVNASVPSSAPSSVKDQALAACKKA